MRTTEERLTAMEGMIREIYSAVVAKNAPIGAPDIHEYARALQALHDGDKQPLKDYLNRTGGKVPSFEEFQKSGFAAPARTRSYRRRPERSLRTRAVGGNA